MFGKLMSISDELMWRYFELLSFKPLDEIAKLRKECAEGRNPRDAKVMLAQEIVTRFHGRAAADAALAEFESQFRDGAMPESMPEVTLHTAGTGLAIPQLIDELPLMAVVGSQIRGGIEIRDAGELRVKESNRIAATVAGLRAMGANVQEFEDGLRVGAPARLHGAVIDSRGDHRIAMTFAIAGLIAEGETEIKDADCVAVGGRSGGPRDHRA